MNSVQPPTPNAGPQPPYAGHPPPGTGRSDDAVVRAMIPVGRTGLSIVAGYLGLLALFVVPAPLALAVGIWAVIDLKKRPEKSGAGRAWFAVIVGALGTGLLALALLSR